MLGRFRWAAVAIATITAATAGAGAQTPHAPPSPGKLVRARGVAWQPSLDAALAAAAKASPARPVLWFRVLGELEGFA